MVSKENAENMKAKGLFFVYEEINTVSPDGIEQKILSQVDLFRSIGIDMELRCLKSDRKTRWQYDEEYSKVDFIYFRRGTTIDYRFVRFFKRIKHGVKPVIFMEIPTYPYEGEGGKSLRSIIKHAIDHYYRRKLHPFIDRIVVTGADVGTDLWGIKPVCIVNGIDLQRIPQRNFKNHGDVINITCVAKFSPWHGYERLINGLSDYYKTKPSRIVRLLMVGEGVEKEKYIELAESLQMSDYIDFLGKKTGNDLEEIYQITDIGVCSLGRYKSNFDVIGDLKSREFMAKGIPMICGCKIDVLEGKNYSYAITFPNNGSNIDIEEVLRFYDGLRLQESELEMSKKIRSISSKWIDYKETYEKVLSEASYLVLNESK